MTTNLFGDVVVVIPGICGSRLVRREGTREVTVWDFSIGSLPRLIREMANDRLVLEQHDSAPDDGVEAAGLFSCQWLPGFFGVDDYAPLVDRLRATVSDQGQLLTFPYDWRASNRFAAKRLESTALDALNRWKAASGNQDAKLWLVCHSMGGLVARYFCEHLDGAAHTRAIVTIGTPHRGSLQALDTLANGKKIAGVNLTTMLRSLPSVYELLPLFPAIRAAPGAPLDLRRVADFFALDPVSGADLLAGAAAPPAVVPAPLANLDRRMLKSALEFHAKIRVPSEARESKGEPAPYRQEAFFNRRQLTPVSAILSEQGLDMLTEYPSEQEGKIQYEIARGDGTVPSFSSVPIEWPSTDGAIALADKHAAMQVSTFLLDAMFNWLRPMDLRTLKGQSVNDQSVVELNVPPVIGQNEDLAVNAASLRAMGVKIQIEHVEDHTVKQQTLALPGNDEHAAVFFRGLRPGVYRVKAIPKDRMVPVVSDYVLVTESH